jgi:hypothetical protein
LRTLPNQATINIAPKARDWWYFMSNANSNSITIIVTEENAPILKMLASGKDQAEWATEAFNKLLKSQEKPAARSRLNTFKNTAHQMILSGAVANLERFYNNVGLSKEVSVFGGIAEVYQKIYFGQGKPLPAGKIREEIVAVPKAS